MSQIILAEQAAAPSTPSSGKVALYVTTTPEFRLKDDAGNVITIPQVLSGTWTPTIIGSTTAGTHTYTAQLGRYIKIGTLVLASFNVVINAKDGTMAGNAQISGLPFTVRISSPHYAGSIAFWGTLATSIVFLGIHANLNTTKADLHKATAATASVAALVAADIANGTQIIGTLMYESET